MDGLLGARDVSVRIYHGVGAEQFSNVGVGRIPRYFLLDGDSTEFGCEDGEILGLGLQSGWMVGTLFICMRLERI